MTPFDMSYFQTGRAIKINRLNLIYRWLILIVCNLAGGGLPTELNADELQLTLKDGSAITVQMIDQNIRWTDLRESGKLVQRDVPLATIKTLVLSPTQASEQATAVVRLLNDLSSSRYFDRQSAEDQLSDPAIGGPFRSLIESQTDHVEFEVRYRIQRIISRLKRETEIVSSDLDVLTTDNGRQIEGYAGEFSLTGKFRGNDIMFVRSQVSLITKSQKKAPPAESGEELSVEIYHDHKGSFYLNDQAFIGFESTPAGHDLPGDGNVTDSYVPLGLKPETKQNGFVGVSGYRFKFDRLPVRGNSVCVFENTGGRHERFRGVMEFKFCMPNQPAVTAGVREFGLFIARVGHSRDIIMEAYSADGHLLACVESTDQPCVFTGVKSNELITKIRILSNPYLFRVDRTIDNDYAVDSVCFSHPEVATNTPGSDKKSIRLKNGDLLVSHDLNIGNVISTRVNNKPYKIPIDKVDAIQFGKEEVLSETPSWAVLLKDGSLLYVKTGDRFSSEQFPGLEFSRAEIAAIANSKMPIRFPAAGDFEKGNNVVVFPTCRIATDVIFSPAGFSWNKSAIKIQQPLFTGKEDPAEEDPTPQMNSIQYETAWPEDTPTVWLSPPMAQSCKLGRIRLADGQQLSIGPGATFQFESLSQEQVILSAGGQNRIIRIQDVLSIVFPNQ